MLCSIINSFKFHEFRKLMKRNNITSGVLSMKLQSKCSCIIDNCDRFVDQSKVRLT